MYSMKQDLTKPHISISWHGNFRHNNTRFVLRFRTRRVITVSLFYTFSNRLAIRQDSCPRLVLTKTKESTDRSLLVTADFVTSLLDTGLLQIRNLRISVGGQFIVVKHNLEIFVNGSQMKLPYR